ncbi:MAG: hypothetical protein IJB09_06795 [Oscillospiraceae bacterium]|nr:hypothetical protein [Oscillospiraceae bacterium]
MDVISAQKAAIILLIMLSIRIAANVFTDISVSQTKLDNIMQEQFDAVCAMCYSLTNID